MYVVSNAELVRVMQLVQTDKTDALAVNVTISLDAKTMHSRSCSSCSVSRA